MKKKRKAAALLAAVLLAGAAAPGNAVGAVQGEEKMSAQVMEREINLTEAVNPGKIIREVVTNRSMYYPGETIQGSIRFSDGDKTAGQVRLCLCYLNQVVWEQELPVSPQATELSFALSAPERDFTGYALEVYCYLDGKLADYTMTGVDVSSDWNMFPRYGYVTKMDSSVGEVAESLERLKDHHINGLFYYDVFDTQEKPLAGTVEAPAESWNTLNKSLAKKQTVLDTIRIGHELNMKSFFYNLIFGTYDNYEQAGVSPEWGMYCDRRHQDQDVHDISGIGWETEKFWLMNPANRLWQDYYIQVHQDLFSVYPYDGIQVDSLGPRGERFDYEGNEIQLDNAYVPMLNRLVQELGKKVIFNPVSAYGMEPQLKAVDYDIVYMEVWPSDTPDFAALKEKVDEIYQKSKGEKGTVIAAYMNYDAPKSENFNTPSINYVNAVLMSAGASHLELGDTGMLSSEYYPGNSMQITSRLEEDVRREYDFMVAYENLLRGTGLSQVEDETYICGQRTGADFKPGNVTSFTKVKHQEGESDREVLHLLNFDGAAHDSWVDKGLAQTAPNVKQQVTVSHKVTKEPTKIWVASPDYQDGISEEIAFTAEYGTVTFTLPYLEYYTMVVME